MISVRMPMDIHPRCDRHPEHRMVPVMMQLAAGPDQPWFPVFVCGQRGGPHQGALTPGIRAW